MIYNIQTWRAVCATLIFIHHFGFETDNVMWLGDYAVTFFMMLSGFVMTLSQRRKGGNQSVHELMKGRIIRIYPLYIMGMSAMFLINKFHYPPGAMLADVLMMQTWIPDAAYFFSGNGPCWFVSDLMFCSLIFMPVLRLLNADTRRFIYFTAAIVMLYFVVVFITPSRMVLALIYVQPLMQAVQFVIGMGLCLVVERLRTLSVSACRADMAMVCAIAATALFAALYLSVPTRFSFGSYWWLPVISTICILVVTDKTECAATRLLHSKIFVKAGDAAMSFYIIHYPWLTITRLILDKSDFNPPAGVTFAISLAALWAIAFFVHRYVEKPLTRLLTNHIAATK